MIEFTVRLFDECILERIPASSDYTWLNSLSFRAKLLSKVVFPGYIPVVGAYRKEIPELFGLADAMVAISPDNNGGNLYLYVFQNGYPLSGTNNFTIGIINSLELPFSIIPAVPNPADKENLYCVKCKIPRLTKTSMIIVVNSSRSDIVGFSARAIEGAFKDAISKNPWISGKLEEVQIAKGCWKTIQSIQESMTMVLEDETISDEVWRKCCKILNSKFK